MYIYMVLHTCMMCIYIIEAAHILIMAYGASRWASADTEARPDAVWQCSQFEEVLCSLETFVDAMAPQVFFLCWRALPRPN